jgi:hypothetical protein
LIKWPFYVMFLGLLGLLPLGWLLYLTGLMGREDCDLYMSPIILAAFGLPWLAGVYCHWCNFRWISVARYGRVSPERFPKVYYATLGIPVLVGLATFGIGAGLLIRAMAEGR